MHCGLESHPTFLASAAASVHRDLQRLWIPSDRHFSRSWLVRLQAGYWARDRDFVANSQTHRISELVSELSCGDCCEQKPAHCDFWRGCYASFVNVFMFIWFGGVILIAARVFSAVGRYSLRFWQQRQNAWMGVVIPL